jgi:hypothetical protein
MFASQGGREGRTLVKVNPKQNQSNLGRALEKNQEESYFSPDLYKKLKHNHIRNVKALEKVV